MGTCEDTVTSSDSALFITKAVEGALYLTSSLMASLSSVLGIALGHKELVLIGKPEISDILDSDDKPYYIFQLKEQVDVRCSVDTSILPVPTTEVYVREDALGLDWQFVDEKNPEAGFFMKGWRADFSVTHRVVLYQPETIKQWAQDQRKTRRSQRTADINKQIREKIAGK